MRAISPVVRGFEHTEIILAKDQPEYEALPALPVNRNTILITRWRFDWRERLAILFGGNIFLWVWTFGKPLQPIALQVSPPEMSPESPIFRLAATPFEKGEKKS